MSKIADSALELVGEPPLLKLCCFAEKAGAVNANIYGKLACESVGMAQFTEFRFVRLVLSRSKV